MAVFTFFASFLAFFCFCADAFSILCRRRTGLRFDVGSAGDVSDSYGILSTVCTYFRSSSLVAVDVLVGHFFHPIIFEIPTLAKILPLSAACLLEPRPTLGIEQQQPRSSTAPHVVSAFDSGQNHRELLRVVFTELSSRPPH